jgi:hypothetical protein
MTSKETGTGADHARSEQPLRASDADRLATVRILQDAVVRGLLTPDECSHRMAAAFGAVHRHDLEPLTADLPAGPPLGRPPGWRALGTMAVEQARYSVATRRTGRLHPGWIAAAVVLAVVLMFAMGMLIGDLLFDGDFGRGTHGFDD